MHARHPLLPWCWLLLLVGAGCSSTRQIQTAPPTSVVRPDTTETVSLAWLTVLVETGETALPEDIQAMRFRVTDVYLKTADGAWTSYPADANNFEITTGRRARKAVLSTRIPPAPYDSLALSLSDIFVLYEANAGGPLTMPRDTPLTLPITMHLATGRHATLRLIFEPGASLSRDDRCRWFFLPFLQAFVE